MNELSYRINLEGITSSPVFKDASADEFRALLALIAAGGSLSSAAELAQRAGISSPRASAAIALWEQAGVIAKAECGGLSPLVVDEFNSPNQNTQLDDEKSQDVALQIRNEKLEELIFECAELMKRPSLNTQEIKHITALFTQLALSEEYILTLAAYLAQSGRLTALRLSRKAEALSAKGIDTVEELQRYITDAERESTAEKEFRRLFKIYNRSLSKTEKSLFYRWSEEFGYTEAIILAAYNIAVDKTHDINLPYMDKLLTAWHEAGCKTVESCLAKYEADKPLFAAKGKSQDSRSKVAKPEADTPKYADFNSEDALMRALKRSYGDIDNKK